MVVGGGVRRDWLRQEVNANGLTNVSVPGSYPIAVMPGLLRQAAVLLVTLADRPAFRATVPSKVQTYMAIGRPILASLNGEGARLVQEAGAGLATPAEDAAALAQALLQLYRLAPEERARLGANGRRYFETHFERSRLVDRLLGHFRLFVDSHRSEQ